MIINWLLAAVSAALLIATFPRADFSWFAPIALAPLLVVSAREDRWPWRFAFGYAAGAIYWFGTCNWIQWTLEQHAGISAGVSWFLFALFCLAKALQMGVFSSAAGVLFRTAAALPAIAALWVAIEWTHGVMGFEWLNLGNAGSDMSVPLRLAPFTGVWGISFVFALMSAGLASAVVRRPRWQLVWLLLLPAILLLPDVPSPVRGDATAVLVQPNISEDTVWSPERLQRTEQQLTFLSVGPLLSRERPADLVVWPEVPAPFYDYDSSFIAMAASVAKTGATYLLAGVVAKTPAGAPLNSALLMDKDGAMISRYDKVNLVPFGEFVPFPFGAITKKVSSEAGDFEAGRNIVVSRVGTHRIGAFICYESVFPGYIRKFAASGAEALFNLSNDSWFGKSAAREQHLRIVRMRAVENHRWILRATNNGITAAIDPAGRLVRTVPEYIEIAARMPYRYLADQTLYTRFGDWFVAVCALAATATLLRSAGLPTRRRL